MKYRENSTALSSPSAANGKWSAEVDERTKYHRLQLPSY
jgi:hypothetical protein